jgi:DMSO/TMAO reductase YedYZ molybdopterin-dependent catalytic subunit
MTGRRLWWTQSGERPRRGGRPRRGLLALTLAALLGAGLPAAAVVAGPVEAPAAQSTTFAPEFAVAGLVGAPRSFTRDDLGGLPQVTLPVVYGSGSGVESAVFTGPRLLDVLDAAGGPKFPPERNAKLRTYVLATGADGYQAVLAWGELDPDFGAQPVLVAWQRDGQPLGEGQGVARLVVPADKRGGRHVATVTRIELRDSAAPAASAATATLLPAPGAAPGGRGGDHREHPG